MTTEGLEGMAAHFLPCHHTWTWDGRMWSIIRCSQEVRSRIDSIIGIERRRLQNVAVWDPRHNTDHYLVLGCLQCANLRENQWYLGKRRRLPLLPIRQLYRKETFFTSLWNLIPKTHQESTHIIPGYLRISSESLTPESPSDVPWTGNSAASAI